MERNIGAQNRKIPPDVQPKGSTSRDLEHIDERAPLESALEEPGGATGAPEAEASSDMNEGRDVE
jgi:hypothetical protein